MNKNADAVAKIRIVLSLTKAAQSAGEIRWLLSEVALALGDDTVPPVAGFVRDGDAWRAPADVHSAGST